jgi:hypothetical protein
LTSKNSSVSRCGGKGWFKSSYSNSGGSCVEVNLGADATLVRDSKDRRADQPVLCVSREGWSAFLNAVGCS